jgi:hypothetical protein
MTGINNSIIRERKKPGAYAVYELVIAAAR